MFKRKRHGERCVDLDDWVTQKRHVRPLSRSSSSNHRAGAHSFEPGATITMTTVANLLARKQQLLDRLHEDPGSHERHEIERVLAQIDTALNFLDEPVGASGDEQ